MVHEAQNNWNDPSLPEGVTRAANGWCVAIYGSACSSTEHYINFFSSYGLMSSRSVAVRNGASPSDVFNEVASFNSTAAESLTKVTDALQNPGDWTDWAGDGPYGWGNLSLYPEDVKDVFEANQAALFQYYGTRDNGGDPWIIPSGCAWKYWANSNSRDLNHVCPAVDRK